jgi:hypothetical protein
MYDLFLPLLLLSSSSSSSSSSLFLFCFHLYLGLDSSVSIVTRLKTEQLANQVLIQGEGSVCFTPFTTMFLELSQPPIQCVQGLLTSRVKGPWCDWPHTYCWRLRMTEGWVSQGAVVTMLCLSVESLSPGCALTTLFLQGLPANRAVFKGWQKIKSIGYHDTDTFIRKYIL